ncbi:hypothetical protein ID866_4157 [Astraeus odoratus]|nr:hypothetical protein ID866_4157 [Astraeus odoratus]
MEQKQSSTKDGVEYPDSSDPEPALAGSETIIKSAADIANLIISSEDDPSLPALTFRFWVIGTGLATFGSVLSEIYFWKPQGATVSSLFQLIISYVLGNTMHYAMPSTGFWRWLNPGPFNIKEHACITIMASTASLTASSIGIIATLDLFYGISLPPASAILRTFASQLIGYGFAVSQMAGYASMGAAFSHIALWHWKELWTAFRGFNFLKSGQAFDDIHFQKMKVYKEVPQWWYCMLFGVSLCLAIGMAYVDVNTLPWWSIMMFTGIGQYAKIPPCATFVAQFIGTVIGATFNYVLYRSIVHAHRAELQDAIGTRLWSGWNAQQINSVAITWGALAKELYAPGLLTQWWARTRRPKWYMRYNYLTSAALDGGSSVIYFILNFAVFGAGGKVVSFPYWWGNPDPSISSVERVRDEVQLKTTQERPRCM